MENLLLVNYVIAVLFAVCYSYQFFFVLISLPRTRKKKAFPVAKHRFAIIISARNEEKVLPQLLQSIKNQDYPAHLLDVFVIADNCTDNTAQVALEGGAIVYKRYNKSLIGKGYALDYLFKAIDNDYSIASYDAYIVLDADNLLDTSYITEMNKSFSDGYHVLTSYRNSKNFDSNWISAGYSLWFLREAKYLNRPRHRIHSSCAVSGTGFLVHRDIIIRNNGWKHFLLTEDIEFTADCILHGDKIGFCESAILYDEQPVSLKQSCRQRLRWAKGYLQVFRRYGLKLLAHFFSDGAFGCLDMIMSTMPAVILTVISLTINFIALLIGAISRNHGVLLLFESVTESLFNIYLMLFLMGALTTVTEWKMIHASSFKKILYLFTFPLFMLTYLPISFSALFLKVEWKPINHNVVRSISDVTLRRSAASSKNHQSSQIT